MPPFTMVIFLSARAANPISCVTNNMAILFLRTISNNKSENCDIWACGIIMYYLLIGEYPTLLL